MDVFQFEVKCKNALPKRTSLGAKKNRWDVFSGLRASQHLSRGGGPEWKDGRIIILPFKSSQHSKIFKE